MNKDNIVKFLNKQFDRMFEGLGYMLWVVVGLMLIGAIVLFTIVAPYVVCIIIGFWVLCYIVGFVKEKLYQGHFDLEFGCYPRYTKDKIKKWRTDIPTKLKSVTTSYLKHLKDLWSLTQKYWK